MKVIEEQLGKTVECKICNETFGNLVNHLRLKHNISCKEYKIIFNSPVMSDFEIDRLRKRMKNKSLKKMMKIKADKGRGKYWDEWKNERREKLITGYKLINSLGEK